MAAQRVGQATFLNAVQDAAIEFVEVNHTYFITDAGKLLVVTPKTNSSFDADTNSWNSARRKHENLGLSVEDAQRYFLTEYTDAKDFGKRVHRIIELFLKEEDRPDQPLEHNYHPDLSEEGRAAFERNHPLKTAQLNIANIFENFKIFYEKVKQKYVLVASEYMIWERIWDSSSEPTTRAGTIDAVFWSNKDKREVVIMDWTTSAGLTTKWQETNRSIFNGEMRSKLDKKFCQLHTYMTILERNYNVIVKACIVVQLEDGRCIIHRDPNLIPCKCIRHQPRLRN